MRPLLPTPRTHVPRLVPIPTARDHRRERPVRHDMVLVVSLSESARCVDKERPRSSGPVSRKTARHRRLSARTDP